MAGHDREEKRVQRALRDAALRAMEGVWKEASVEPNACATAQPALPPKAPEPKRTQIARPGAPEPAATGPRRAGADSDGAGAEPWREAFEERYGPGGPCMTGAVDAPLELEPRQLMAVRLMLSGRGVTEVARHLGVDRHTVSAWRKDPAFAREVRRMALEMPLPQETKDL